jgi:uncharacterized protein DUF397
MNVATVKATELVGAEWRKSTRSSGTGQCVEVARNLPGVVALRDSKDPAGPALLVSPSGWAGFLGLVQDGDLDPRR